MLHPSLRALLSVVDDPRMSSAPGAVRNAAAGVRRADELRRNYRAQPGTANLVLSIASRLASGGSPGDDLHEVIAATVVTEQRDADVQRVLTGVQDEVHLGFAAIVREHRDELLSGPLRTELGAVLAEVETLRAAMGDLDPSRPGDFVAASDEARRAFLELPGLAGRYEWLRGAQRTVICASEEDSSAADTLFQSHAHEAPDFARIWPDWRTDWASDPWPPASADRFLFALKHTLWVPTMSEASAALANTRSRSQLLGNPAEIAARQAENEADRKAWEAKQPGHGQPVTFAY